MASPMKWTTRAPRRSPSPPIRVPTSSYEAVHPSEILDEELFEHFEQGQYYPANIGDLIGSRYQIIGKLGFGVTSKVWLAPDLE